jgi:hypothetical protein
MTRLLWVPPPLSSPAPAGEDEGGGLNGAKRLNGLNVLNRRYRLFIAR